jgi:hypothetical protein
MNETDILYSIVDAEVTSDKEAYDIWSKYKDATAHFRVYIAHKVENIRLRERLWRASTAKVVKLIRNDWKEKE